MTKSREVTNTAIGWALAGNGRATRIGTPELLQTGAWICMS